MDLKKAADVVSTMVSGHIKRNVARGKGGNDRALAPYSASYVRALIEAGEAVDVDFRLTGGLMDSITERGRDLSGDRAIVKIGPGSGTSPEVSLVKGRAKRTGKRGPPHNVVGAYLSKKWPGWLDISQKAMRRVAKAVEKAGVLVSRR